MESSPLRPCLTPGAAQEEIKEKGPGGGGNVPLLAQLQELRPGVKPCLTTQPRCGISRPVSPGSPVPWVMNPESLCAPNYWGQGERPGPLPRHPVHTPCAPRRPGAWHPSLFHGPEAQEGHPGNLGMLDTMHHRQGSATVRGDAAARALPGAWSIGATKPAL